MTNFFSQDLQRDFDQRLVGVESRHSSLSTIFEQDKALRHENYQEEQGRLQSAHDKVIESMAREHKAALEMNQSLVRTSDAELRKVREDAAMKLSDLRSESARELNVICTKHIEETEALRRRVTELEDGKAGDVEVGEKDAKLVKKLEESDIKLKEKTLALGEAERQVKEGKYLLKDLKEKMAALGDSKEIAKLKAENETLRIRLAVAEEEGGREKKPPGKKAGSSGSKTASSEEGSYGKKQDSKLSSEADATSKRGSISEVSNAVSLKEVVTTPGGHAHEKKVTTATKSSLGKAVAKRKALAKKGPLTPGSTPRSGVSTPKKKAKAKAKTTHPAPLFYPESEPVLSLAPLYSDKMGGWRKAMQDLEDEFLGLSQREWKSSRSAFLRRWEEQENVLGNYITLLLSSCGEKSSLRRRLDAFRSSCLKKVQKRYEEGAFEAAEVAGIERFFEKKVWAEFSLLNEKTGKKRENFSKNISLSSGSSDSEEEDEPRVLPPFDFDSLLAVLKKKAPLDLWRDALLIAPAVEDLAEDLVDFLNQKDPANSRLRRTLSLSKGMARGMEKILFHDQQRSDKDSSKPTSLLHPLSDVARVTLVVANSKDFEPLLNWICKEKSLVIVRARLRLGKNATRMGWEDCLLSLTFIDKPDTIFEIQIVTTTMFTLDLRNTEEFEELRLVSELLGCF